MAEQGRMQQLTHQQNDNRLHQDIAVERTKVLERIPEWSDGDTQADDQRKLMAYGQTEGYSPEELNQLYDARAVVILRKAMLYDELTTGDKITAAKSKIGSVKGGNQETSRRVRSRKAKAARAKLKQTGKVDDAAALFAEILTD